MKLLFKSISDLQQNKEFLSVDKVTKLFSYSLPSQRCMVLQFDKGHVCKYKLSDIFGDAILGQSIPPVNDHIILRQDTAYLYPHPMYSNLFGHLLYLRIQEYNKTIEYDIHDGLTLTFVHWKSIHVHQKFQGHLQLQKKIHLKEQRCLTYFNSPPILRPIAVSIQAVLFPSVNELDYEKSFRFAKDTYQPWSEFSHSWVSSKLYHINCSLDKRVTAHDFYLHFKDILKICISRNALDIRKFVCLFCPKLFIQKKQDTFILSISLNSSTILSKNSSIGILTVSNLFKHFCDTNSSEKYVKYSYLIGISTLKGQFVVPIECAELIVTYNIHSNFFKAENNYNIAIQVALFQYAELQFFKSFLDLALKNNVTLLYKWKKEEVILDQQFLF